MEAAFAATLREVLPGAPELAVIEDEDGWAVAGGPYHGLDDPERSRWTVVRSVCKALGPDLRIALVAADGRSLPSAAGHGGALFERCLHAGPAGTGSRYLQRAQAIRVTTASLPEEKAEAIASCVRPGRSRGASV